MGILWQWVRDWYLRQLERPWPLALFAGGCTLLSVWIIAHATIEGNPVALLPQQDPAVVEQKAQEARVGATNYLLITIRTAEPQLGPPVVDALAAQLRTLPEIISVDARTPVDFFHQVALLYLPYDELNDFATHVEQRLHELTFGPWIPKLHTPERPISVQPFLERYPYIRNLRYYQNADGTTYYLLVRPRIPASNTTLTRQMMTRIRPLVAQALAQVPHATAGNHPVRIDLSGRYVETERQAGRIIHDTWLVVLYAFGGLAAFFCFFYRDGVRLLNVCVPLALGTVWSFAADQWLFGGINFLTVSSCVTAMGLCASCGIRLIHHYDRSPDRSAPIATQMRDSARDFLDTMRLPGLIVAAALGFLAFTRFRALAQFGLLTIISINLHLVSLLCAFPVCLRWLLRQHAIRPALLSPRLRLQGARWLLTEQGFLSISSLGVILLLGLFLQFPTFNVNLAKLLLNADRPHTDLPNGRLLHAILSPELARTANADDAAAFAQALRRTSARTQSSRILATIALHDFLPDGQTEKIARIANLRTAFTEPAIELLPPDERAAYDLLRPALMPFPVTVENLPEEVLGKFRALDGKLGEYVYILPDLDRQSAGQLREFVQEVSATACPDCSQPVRVSGESFLYYSIVSHLVTENLLIVGAGVGTIFLILLAALRNRRDALLCSLPPLIAVALTMGAMVWCGIELNLVNIGAIPLILGLTVNSATLLQQHLTKPNLGLVQGYLLIAPFLCASAITLLLAFVGIGMAENPGLRSFGRLAALGTAIGASVVLLWLPGLVSWWTTPSPSPAPDKTP